MNKTILATLLGGVILYVWSFIAWVILPLHAPHLHPIPNEDAVVSLLRSSLDKNAVYVFPANPSFGSDQATMDAYVAKMKRGPTGMIFYSPFGQDPMMPSQMIIGFVLDLLSAFVVVWFLLRSTALSSSYFGRVAFCGMFGIFTALFTHFMYWNWMGFPAEFTKGLIVDGIVSWILAGLGIAALIKPKNTEPAAPAAS
ncbi:MAG TPA: hypothetical protein VLY03_06320 [Bacteroidota bacterium]|nr:hypothetical protein [Bacteroidota bacterium]